MVILSYAADVLSNHLINPSNVKAKYRFPDIQNEVLSIVGKQIREKIVNDCNKSDYFAILADKATDTSTKEQVSLLLRFIDSTCNSFEIREEFVGFLHAHSIQGEALATLLLNTTDQYDIGGDKICAQGCDRAGNTARKHQGVQVHIRQCFPEAAYVHCKSHCLNLATVHSCKDPSVHTIMGTVQDIAFMFNYSAKHMEAFYSELESDDLTKDIRTKLRTLCGTHWTSRAVALHTFKEAFPVTVSALEHLKQNGDDKANQYLAAISRFNFIIGLPVVTTEHILQSIVDLTTFLQSVSFDLLQAVHECKLVIDQLSDERNKETVWCSIFDCAVTTANKIEAKRNRKTS